MDNTNLDNFNGIKIDLEYDQALEECALDCKVGIQSIAKSNKWNNYSKGWEVKKKREGRKGHYTYYYVVWNKTHYRLTHLLENGHLIVNKKGSVGWSSARPHIKPVFDVVKNKVEDIVKQKTTLNIK